MPPDKETTPANPFPKSLRYNSYNNFLRERFGCRVAKVVVDAGLSCPNRDGTVAVGGCTYCNNDAFRPRAVSRLDPVRVQVEKGIAWLKQRFRAQRFIVYFQPFSNTHAPLDLLVPLYESALDHPEVVGISVGTRPDCIDESKLAWFGNLARTRFVSLEYGLESIYDRTMIRINRGHDYACWQRAVEQSRGRGLYLGAHLILGFPWETREEILAMAPEISSAGLDFLKLHHLHIVRGTELARQFVQEPFPLLPYEEYLDLLIGFLEFLNPAIRLERLFGLAPASMLLGPRWGKTRAEAHRDIERALSERDTWQGRRYLQS